MEEKPPKPKEYSLEDKDWLEIVDTPGFEFQGNGEELVNPDLRERIKSINNEQAEYEYAVSEEEKNRANHEAEEREARRLAEVKEHLGLTPIESESTPPVNAVQVEVSKTRKDWRVERDKRKLGLAVRAMERQMRMTGMNEFNWAEVPEFPAENAFESKEYAESQAKEELEYKESVENRAPEEKKKDGEDKAKEEENALAKLREEKQKNWKKMSTKEKIESVGVFAKNTALMSSSGVVVGVAILGAAAHAFFLEYFAVNIITEGYSRLKKWLGGGILTGGSGGHKPAKAAAHKPAAGGGHG